MEVLPEFLTVSEVARIFRTSKMTIYRMCESGEITSRRVGKSIRIYTRLLCETHPVSHETIHDVINSK